MRLRKLLLSVLFLTFVFTCVSGKAVNAMESKKVVLNPLPKSAAEIKPANTPQQTAAYAIAALVRYTEDAEAGIAMLDVLRGPRPLNNFNKQFLRDQLRGKEYTPKSYFDGATVDNNYTPSTPYTLTVSENPYSYQNEGYARLLLKSGGADNPRFITVTAAVDLTAQFAVKTSTGVGTVVTDTDDPQVRKIVLDGHVYILRGDRLYSLQGQQIQ